MRLFVAVVSLWFSSLAFAIQSQHYFPEPVTFNPDIPTPESVLGYEVGQWHVRHDQLVEYMRVLAQKSDRMTLKTIGYSHEHRPLVQLIATRPDRLGKLETVRQQHVNNISAEQPLGDTPLVMWMGYSVHGNEPSGSNASVLVAYYLAAAQGPEVERFLNDMVIIIEPSLNPDGLSRFAQWVNANKGKTENTDVANRLHNERWPSGRTNHYWFDLNRDWLLLVHPESQARIAQYNRWMPNVFTDFHEMGSNSTFFFQPGIPARKNPMTPQANVDLTKVIAKYHAERFDKQNVLYFTEESYDDFYAGKGSTYPDLNAAVGILFEQASARGFARDTVNGKLTFTNAIKNQLSASLSSLKGASENKVALLAHQRQFYQAYQKLADKDDIQGFVLTEAKDKTRFNALLKLLKAHRIMAYPLAKDFKAGNTQFDKEHSYYVPLNQPQYRLIRSVFSRQKSFDDNTFYDVSNWNMAWSFNITFEAVSSEWGLKYGETPWQEPAPLRMRNLTDAYAYAFAWDDAKAPVLLQYFLANGLEVRFADKAFSVATDSGAKRFEPGAIVIAKGLQQSDNWLEVLRSGRDKTMVELSAIHTGLSASGIDIGSRSMHKLIAPKVLLLGGRGVSNTEAGEIWHYLDTELGLAPTIVEWTRLGRVDLSDYTHLLMVDGQYSQLSDKQVEKIQAWVRQGGVLWGQKSAAQWLIDKQMLKGGYVSEKELGKRFEKGPLSYGDMATVAGKQRIAGAVFEVELDLSHPLAFGFEKSALPVFKNSTLLLDKSATPFITVGSYSKFPQLGGYAAAENVERIAGSSFILAHSLGRGVVIGVADDVNFRGIWHGTRRLLSNSLYFGHTIEASGD